MSTELEPSETEALVQSLLPFHQDNNKARYIGYRASGFTVSEAVKLVGIHRKTVSRWRDPNSPWYDAGFVDAENKLTELRKTLGIEYAHLEFLRNYRLVLEKDFSIIKKSINQPLSLTGQEQQYLLKARSHYTPQQLEVLQRLIGGVKGEAQFNFTDFVMTMKRTRTEDEIKLESAGGSYAVSELPEVPIKGGDEDYSEDEGEDGV